MDILFERQDPPAKAPARIDTLRLHNDYKVGYCRLCKAHGALGTLRSHPRDNEFPPRTLVTRCCADCAEEIWRLSNAPWL